MRAWFTLADIVALALLLFILDMTYLQISTAQEEYNEIRLSRAVEYASEAAFYNSISQQDAGLSYLESTTEDAYNVPLSTQSTLDTFDLVMSYNYGFAPGETAYNTIEDSIGVMLLCCTDGYYITDRTRNSEEGEGLVWTVKLPYSYEFTSNGQYVTYALTLNTQKYTRVSITGDDSASGYSLDTGLSYSATGGEMSDAIRRQAVSDTITDAISYYMSKNIGEDPSVSVYIPSTQTLSGINQLSAPTLIVIMDKCSFAGVKNAGATALTGDRLMKKIRVIGYVADGIKKYSYEFQGATTLYAGQDIYYFDTVEEAAQAGYSPDTNFIFNAIDYDRSGVSSSGSGNSSSLYEAYDIAKTYTIGNMVTYQGYVYVCNKQTTGAFNSSCWTVVAN